MSRCGQQRRSSQHLRTGPAWRTRRRGQLEAVDDNPGVLHDEGKDGFQAHPGHAGGRRAGKQRRPRTEGKIHGDDRVILQRGLAYLAAEPLDQTRQDVAYLAGIGDPQQVPDRLIRGQHRVGVDACKRVKQGRRAMPGRSTPDAVAAPRLSWPDASPGGSPLATSGQPG